MMKKNKGFTLVELLAIMTILGVMVILVMPQIGGSINSKKEKELEKIIDIIESAGKAYHTFNNDEYKIPVDTLVSKKYLSNDLINPVTNEKLDGCVRVFKDGNGVFNYKYATCERVEVPVTIDLKGGTSTQFSQEITQNTYDDFTKIELVDPTKQNSNFKEWQVVKGNSYINGKRLVVGDTETIVYAIWENWPTLSLNLNEGSLDQSLNSQYKSGTNITLKTPTREGYKFTRWSVNEGVGASVVSGNNFTMGSIDTTLTANWEANSYTITYNLNGGTKGTYAPTSGTYGSTVTVSNPTKTNWSFIEWSVSGDGASMNGTSLTIGTGNVTLTAKYKANLSEYITKLYEDTSTRSSNSLEASDPDSNIRYVGASPKNYLKFNNENWRIIGIFEFTTASGSTEKLAKIVRNSPFSTKMSWDSSSSSVNGGYGINEWSQADLKKVLNTYYIGTSTTCTYCNGLSQGTCSNDCSSSVTPIGSTYRDLIESVVWNTGAIEDEPIIERWDAYKQERGTTTGKLCTGVSTCNDSVTRTTTWTGKVGLIYPSDYGYASTSGTDVRNPPIGTNNWLNFGSGYWTLTPYAISEYNTDLWFASTGDEDIGTQGAGNAKYVHPALYLKSDVYITSGDGSISNPYIIMLN